MARLKGSSSLAAGRTVLKQVPSYALVLDKNGPSLKLAEDGDVRSPMREDRAGRHFRERMPIANLTHFLSLQLGSPVADETGLKGVYMVTLDYFRPRVRRGRAMPS